METTKRPTTKNASYTARIVRTALQSAGFPMSNGMWEAGYYVARSENMVMIGYEAGLAADADRTSWRQRSAEARAFLEAAGYVFVPGMPWIRCEK